MGKEPSVEKLEAERRGILESALSGTADESWPRIRKILEDSESLYTDEHVNTIWEGPTRGWLLPLTLEALHHFTRRFPCEASKYLVPPCQTRSQML
jgi:hypothetical protein